VGTRRHGVTEIESPGHDPLTNAAYGRDPAAMDEDRRLLLSPEFPVEANGRLAPVGSGAGDRCSEHGKHLVFDRLKAADGMSEKRVSRIKRPAFLRPH